MNSKLLDMLDDAETGGLVKTIKTKNKQGEAPKDKKSDYSEERKFKRGDAK